MKLNKKVCEQCYKEKGKALPWEDERTEKVKATIGWIYCWRTGKWTRLDYEIPDGCRYRLEHAVMGNKPR